MSNEERQDSTGRTDRKQIIQGLVGQVKGLRKDFIEEKHMILSKVLFILVARWKKMWRATRELGDGLEAGWLKNVCICVVCVSHRCIRYY